LLVFEKVSGHRRSLVPGKRAPESRAPARPARGASSTFGISRSTWPASDLIRTSHNGFG